MHTELVWASRRWRLEQRDDLAKIFAKFPTYWCVQVVVPKSLVPWFQLSTVCWLQTYWIPVSITVNHNACLGEIYIQYVHHFFNTSAQPSTTCLAPPWIFLGRKVHISYIDCNFHFLAGGGCAMFQILNGFSEFQLKSSFICLIEGLYMSYINHSKHFRDWFKPRAVWERSISRYLAVLFQILGVQFSEWSQ